MSLPEKVVLSMQCISLPHFGQAVGDGGFLRNLNQVGHFILACLVIFLRGYYSRGRLSKGRYCGSPV